MSEVSPGGSVVRRYASWLAPKMGFSQEPVAEYAEQRERAYAALFGETAGVYHEALPMVPRIDVRKYHRTYQGKKTTVLVTSGMSDARMTLPRAAEGVPPRAELIFYCNDPCAEYLEPLRQLARFAHDNRTWLYFGHTIPNGDPPAAFWGSEILDTALLMPTVVQKDSEMAERLSLGGDSVNLLWVVPLSSAECQFKLKHGFDAVLGLFEKNKHPHVFEPGRKSYV